MKRVIVKRIDKVGLLVKLKKVTKIKLMKKKEIDELKLKGKGKSETKDLTAIEEMKVNMESVMVMMKIC